MLGSGHMLGLVGPMGLETLINFNDGRFLLNPPPSCKEKITFLRMLNRNKSCWNVGLMGAPSAKT